MKKGVAPFISSREGPLSISPPLSRERGPGAAGIDVAR